jgi:hypothetical protein
MPNVNLVVRSWRFQRAILVIVGAVLFVCLALEASQCISTKTILQSEQVSKQVDW